MHSNDDIQLVTSIYKRHKETSLELDWKPLPLLSEKRDWQAAVLRVVPVREESHAATRM